MAVRLDKWLQVARMFKTRSQATRACAASRVRVNGLVAKPHRPLAVGDRVELEHAGWGRILEVVELRDKPLPKAEAPRVYIDHSPPKPEPERRDRAVFSGARREPGAGRPTKRERREMDKWRRRLRGQDT